NSARAGGARVLPQFGVPGPPRSLWKGGPPFDPGVPPICHITPFIQRAPGDGYEDRRTYPGRRRRQAVIHARPPHQERSYRRRRLQARKKTGRRPVVSPGRDVRWVELTAERRAGGARVVSGPDWGGGPGGRRRTVRRR